MCLVSFEVVRIQNGAEKENLLVLTVLFVRCIVRNRSYTIAVIMFTVQSVLRGGIQEQVEVYKTQVELYKKQMEVYKIQVEVYKKQVEVYKKQVEVYKKQVEVY